MLLITGARGQLGTELSRLLPDAITTDVVELDIADKAAVDAFVRDYKVDTIINCAAYTAVDKAEADEKMAERINVLGPQNLAETGVKLIHISTDYVFDGTSCRPYTEDDMPHPVSVYGKTKRAGEEAVLDKAKSIVLIRTAWLYSSYGNNFVKTMLRLGAEKEQIRVVSDQVGTPTYARDLAKAIVAILPQFKDGHKGIYHFSNQGVCSWYDFAVEIMKLSGYKCQVLPIATADYPTAASRPFYSVLDKSKIIREFNVNIPHWKESLEKCLKQF